MSAALKSVQPQPHAPAPSGRIESSAQVLDFDPGLYSVEISAPETIRLRPGLMLPCIRMDAINAPVHGAGRAHVATLSDSPSIQPGAPPAYLRVEGGKASVMLTIYKMAGARTAPDLRIRLIGPPSEAPAAALAPALPSIKLKLLAHIERTGDVSAPGGQWVGKPGSGAPLEGFSITPEGDGLRPEDIEYQAVLGTDWNTPWMRGGQFCGSRGMSLPLLGIRIRLVGKAATQFRCSYWASFVGKGEVGPVSAGELCAHAGALLEAVRITLESTADVATISPKKAVPTVVPVTPKPAAKKVQPKPLPQKGRGRR